MTSFFRKYLAFITVVSVFNLNNLISAESDMPHLSVKGSAVQLIVDGRPYLMLAGELHNSTCSGEEYMQRVWPHLKALNLNTVIAAVPWELIEPQENHFDFKYVDRMISPARQYDQRLVMLWFGSKTNRRSVDKAVS